MSEARRKVAPAAPEAAVPEPPPAERGVRLDVNAQIVTLEPGLFSVELFADESALTEAGMVLPAARVDPLPAFGDARAYFAPLSETALLLPGTHPSFLRVVGGRVPILLTIYRLTETAAPRLRITSVQTGAAAMPTPAASVGAPASLPSLPLALTVHAAGHGDLHAAGGAWAQAPGNAAPLEGFSILPEGGLAKDSLEYQAILGQDWVSPWMRGGEFCGSRQLALALLGVRVRLCGGAEKTYRVQVWGRFDGAEVGPVEAGEACEMNGAPLQALRVAIVEGRSRR